MATAATKAPVSSAGGLTIIDHQWGRSQFGNVLVTGTAKNTGSRNLAYGSVEVKFYDKAGNLLGNGLDNVNDLGPGETWKFEAMYLGTDDKAIDTYKISVGPSW